jgi:xanthine dehydrogenase/oxidase
MIVVEQCITDIAYSLGIPPETIRERNLYDEGDQTFYNQTLEKCNNRRCWDECLKISEFHERRQAVDEFNKLNRYKKRGISVIPTKYGVSFGVRCLMQGGALVHIYRDGSVLISHGGMEMGQGLHTKMAQVATRVLGVPLNNIYINDTSTDKVPNSSATAASVGSDLNGEAVRDACEILMSRLKPVMETNPNKCWSELVEEAYMNQINLSANGFCKIDVPNYFCEPEPAKPYSYFAYGAGCSEVEIDCLTGDHRVLRTDLVVDVGDSLNPAIDIGQIEGAFIQGYGLMTMEEMKYSPTGVVYTRGPGTYKIPSADDVPREFNVKLLKNSSNPHAIFSSKAVGEPPMFLGSSVFFAIKDAVKSARSHVGLTGPFQFDSPATSERIRLACEDKLTSKVSVPIAGTYKPWTVRL